MNNTWCPQCGPDVRIDEDGCCAMCGATATGPYAETALNAHDVGYQQALADTLEVVENFPAAPFASARNLVQATGVLKELSESIRQRTKMKKIRHKVAEVAREVSDDAAEWLAYRADKVETIDVFYLTRGARFTVELDDVEVQLDWDPHDGWDGPSTVAGTLAKMAMRAEKERDDAREALKEKQLACERMWKERNEAQREADKLRRRMENA